MTDESTTPPKQAGEQYVGDGVYLRYDGHTAILRTNRTDDDVIILERDTFLALVSLMIPKMDEGTRTTLRVITAP